jgi:hypothetical protein
MSIEFFITIDICVTNLWIIGNKFRSFHLSRVPKVRDHAEKSGGGKKIQLWEFPKVSAHHPLDARYYSVVDEPQPS